MGLFKVETVAAYGWRQAFGLMIQNSSSYYGEILVIEDHYNTIHTFRIRDGKKLWEYHYGKQLDTQLLDVGESEIVIYLQPIGRLITLSRDTGEVLRQRSHLRL